MTRILLTQGDVEAIDVEAIGRFDGPATIRARLFDDGDPVPLTELWLTCNEAGALLEAIGDARDACPSKEAIEPQVHCVHCGCGCVECCKTGGPL